jgi:hypothetical protein
MPSFYINSFPNSFVSHSFENLLKFFDSKNQELLFQIEPKPAGFSSF